MNIIKHDNHYLKALNSKLIVDIPHKELQEKVVEILAKTYIDSGKIIPPKELVSLSGGVINEVKRYFFKLKIDELDLCFQNGVRGLYGDVFGLNIVTFHKWIKAFLIEDKRVEAIKIRNTPQIEAKKEPSEADKLKIRDEFISHAKSTYKKSGHFGVYSACIDEVYKVLVEIKKLIDIEYTYNIDEAYDNVLIDLEQRMKTNDLMLRRKLIEQKETLTKESKQVINQAKQITIEELWNQ